MATNDVPGQWDSQSFAYDGAGNIIGIGADVYTYDSLNRIRRAAVTSSGATTTDSYQYDGFGNLHERQVAGPGGTSTLPIPTEWSTNQLTEAEYDGAGNMTQHDAAHRYQWDSVRMLSSRNDGQDVYIYTAGDERIAVKSGETWKWSLRDLGGKVVREMESTGTANWQWVEDFVHRDGQVVGAERPVAAGGRRHMHPDHLGTPRLITNASGQAISRHDFMPFGIELTSNRQEQGRQNKLRFTGHERDFVGGTTSANVDTLDYMHARYYRSEIARFLSVDPKNRRTPLMQPQLYNRYAYAMNDPLNIVDLNGEDVTPVRVLMTGGKAKITYIDSRMVPRLQTLVTTAHKQGVTFTFSSLLRTQDQQDGIKTSNTKNNKGTSPHTAGLAIDINVNTSLKGTDLAGLTTIARGADLSPLRNQADDPPHLQANDLITRGKDGKVDDEFKALVEENQQQVQDYEKLRRECPEAFERGVINIMPPRP